MKVVTVAIIGGGFCGTVAAIRLLSSPRGAAASLPFGSRIVLVEPHRAGEGLAYGSGPACWRLNVPAGKMSAFPERPDDFVAFARSRDPLVTADDFLPRAWYGDYLSDRLERARMQSPRWLSFDRVRVRATGIDVDAGKARIRLADGSVIEARRVLLALGNSPTAAPLSGAREAVNDAWNLRWMERLPTYVPRVLLVGTGLTMVDMALAIAERRPDARVTAISRHGLLPKSQGTGSPARWQRQFDAGTVLGTGPLAARLRRFRAGIAAAGGDWHTGVQRLREAMPDVWRAAPRRLRRQFLRHLRRHWDVHRHRVPDDALSRIETLRTRKRLEIRAGGLVATRQIKDGVVVTWRPRGGDKVREDLFDAVVNVTGPDTEPTRSACPLVQSLLAQGLCEPDGLGLGWSTDPDGRLIDADGNASRVLYYAGPLLRAGYWEAMAVPELRVHVARSAVALAASLGTGTGSYIRRLATPLFRREQASL
jgi:uncharacterized NAD(P)/FAD-binding protein YdhS